MLHEPAPREQKEDKATDYKSKLGIKMFIIYAILYVGFVVINAVKPTLMEINIFGLNLAVIYGFGLIIIAIIQALIYDTYCRKAEAKLNK